MRTVEAGPSLELLSWGENISEFQSVGVSPTQSTDGQRPPSDFRNRNINIRQWNVRREGGRKWREVIFIQCFKLAMIVIILVIRYHLRRGVSRWHDMKKYLTKMWHWNVSTFLCQNLSFSWFSVTFFIMSQVKLMHPIWNQFKCTNKTWD